MKISTEIGSASKITGEEKAVELVAKAGFDAWDFSMSQMCVYDRDAKKLKDSTHPLSGNNYLAFARKLKQIGLDNGIVCNQGHAPVPSYFKEIRDYHKRAIECLKEAGGEILIIHPDNFASAEKNAEMYQELLPFAKECGVKIATENMYGWDRENNRASFAACATKEDFLAHLDCIKDENFVACLDIGHAEIMGEATSAVTMIKTLSSRIKALHLHDNDKHKDSHMPPFSMTIDYKPIIKTLKEIGYDGYFTLEAYAYLESFNSENVFDGIKNMASSAKKLAEMFEQI